MNNEQDQIIANLWKKIEEQDKKINVLLKAVKICPKCNQYQMRVKTFGAPSVPPKPDGFGVMYAHEYECPVCDTKPQVFQFGTPNINFGSSNINVSFGTAH